MGDKKAYIVHLGMPSLHSLGIGQAWVSEGIAESGKSECGHDAGGKHAIVALID